jgi:hypothetical protein
LLLEGEREHSLQGSKMGRTIRVNHKSFIIIIIIITTRVWTHEVGCPPDMY